MATFDLTEQPWIPVDHEGQPTMVSLREALGRAHEFGDVTPPRATLVPALLRQVLLPVVIHACGIPRGEDEWAERWDAGCLDRQAIDTYLDGQRHRFDLFHPETPFGQVAHLETPKGERKPSSLLIPSINVGNNVPLFSARTEAEPPELTPADAAQWLLYTHCWDTAAIKTGAVGDPRMKGGKTTGNPTGPLGQLGVVIPTGRSLFETLLLNTPIVYDGLPTDDRPQWCADPLGPAWAERPPLGLLDLLTWQSRRIRLFPAEGPAGTVVHEVIVAAGDRLVPDPDLEPHTAWNVNTKPKKGEMARRPRRLRAGRTGWQGLDGLLAVDPPPDGAMESSLLLRQVGRLADVVGETYPLSVLTVGVIYGSQWAVVDHVVVDQVPVPVAGLRVEPQLRGALTEMVQQSDDIARALNFLEADLRRAQGGDPIPWDRGQRTSVELIHDLDLSARRLLAGVQREPGRVEDGQRAWQKTGFRAAMHLADRLLDNVPPSAFAGRTDEERNRVHRPANAEASFRRSLAKALPLAVAPTTKQEDD